MTLARPNTLAECFLWLMHHLSPKQLHEIEVLSREELWQLHYWLSPIIKDQLLMENEGLQQHLGRSAFCDDPDLAGQIGNAFWDHLQIVKAAEERGLNNK